jgi:tRNA (mo5U34)-methyltransferase
MDLSASAVTIGRMEDCDDATRLEIKRRFKQLMPWRKGPFSLFGLLVDSEWRSDWKWSRVEPHIASLDGRIVLDVGCGNGYYCWRMVGAGAKMVIGIEPAALYLMQFEAIRHFAGRKWPVHIFPLGIDDIAGEYACFDTVFSMGVFYHRRSPFDHLIQLKNLLVPGGELVLETLVIEKMSGLNVLVPRKRYAKMRNVWFIPSCDTLSGWLARAGFEDVRVVNVTRTTIREQRRTEWMTFESLEDFLDSEDQNLTVEGYPAPLRAVIMARRPM